MHLSQCFVNVILYFVSIAVIAFAGIKETPASNHAKGKNSSKVTKSTKPKATKSVANRGDGGGALPNRGADGDDGGFQYRLADHRFVPEIPRRANEPVGFSAPRGGAVDLRRQGRPA